MHPLWNAYKRAIKSSGLQNTVLKCTFLANYNHGPFSNGDRLFSKQEYLQHFLAQQGPDFFEEQAEAIAVDRNEPMMPDAAKLTLSDWESCPSIKNRGIYATRIYFVKFQDTQKFMGISTPPQSPPMQWEAILKPYWGMSNHHCPLIRAW